MIFHLKYVLPLHYLDNFENLSYMDQKYQYHKLSEYYPDLARIADGIGVKC